MIKTAFAAAIALIVAGPAFAASTFQQTCSNITFKYGGGGQAMLEAMCLRADGSANATSVAIQGIGNQNGTLTHGSGDSSFQKSCGDISIAVKDANTVNLTALCRTSSGSSNSASIGLDGIKNNNGSLTY